MQKWHSIDLSTQVHKITQVHRIIVSDRYVCNGLVVLYIIIGRIWPFHIFLVVRLFLIFLEKWAQYKWMLGKVVRIVCTYRIGTSKSKPIYHSKRLDNVDFDAMHLEWKYEFEILDTQLWPFGDFWVIPTLMAILDWWEDYNRILIKLSGIAFKLQKKHKVFHTKHTNRVHFKSVCRQSNYASVV